MGVELASIELVQFTKFQVCPEFYWWKNDLKIGNVFFTGSNIHKEYGKFEDIL